MCKAILNLFKKESKLPHPEEARLTKPIEDVEVTRHAWFVKYQVPMAYWSYWQNIQITITPDVSFADCSSEEIRVNPYWANPGVLAHEAAHRSYSFLSDDEKAAFAVEHDRQKANSPMVRLLYSINQYGLTSQIEGHAECYRYLAEKMPEDLKIFYPKLF